MHRFESVKTNNAQQAQASPSASSPNNLAESHIIETLNDEARLKRC